MISIFEKKVFEAIKKIPKGKVTTYKLLARKIRNPQSARAVGNACAKNQQLIKIPCHRVIRSDGKIGGYALGQKRKIDLLKREGVQIKNGRISKNFNVKE